MSYATPPNRSADELPWSAWFAAIEDASIDRAIAELYARIDHAVTQRNPTCWLSGRCCDFDAYGHQLFVMGLEIAWLLKRIAPLERSRGGCVFQRGKLCTMHALRPMGCRLYFCQEGTADWQQDQFERFLKDLRAVHDDHELPYAFVEWRGALDAGAKALRAGR